MVKTTRIPLICEPAVNDEGNKVDYKEIYHILWQLQQETRQIKNKAIQLSWEWYNFGSDYKKKAGDYPSSKEVLGYKGLDSYIYDRLKGSTSLNSLNLNTTIRCATKQFQDGLKDYLKGTRAIIEYKENQPLELHNEYLKCVHDGKNYVFTLSLLSKGAAKE